MGSWVVRLGEGGGSPILYYSTSPIPLNRLIPTQSPITDDEPRFRALIEAAIAAKEVPRFKGFKASVKGDAKRAAKASKVCVCDLIGICGVCVCDLVGWVALPRASRARRWIYLSRSLTTDHRPRAPSNRPTGQPRPQEAAEAEALLKAIQEKRGGAGVNVLATMAQDRKRQMDSFLDDLEAKYAGKGNGGKGGKGGSKKAKKAGAAAKDEEEENGFDDIDDEEFARIQAGLKGRK